MQNLFCKSNHIAMYKCNCKYVAMYLYDYSVCSYIYVAIYVHVFNSSLYISVTVTCLHLVTCNYMKILFY